MRKTVYLSSLISGRNGVWYIVLNPNLGRTAPTFLFLISCSLKYQSRILSDTISNIEEKVLVALILRHGEILLSRIYVHSYSIAPLRRIRRIIEREWNLLKSMERSRGDIMDGPFTGEIHPRHGKRMKTGIPSNTKLMEKEEPERATRFMLPLGGSGMMKWRINGRDYVVKCIVTLFMLIMLQWI